MKTELHNTKGEIERKITPQQMPCSLDKEVNLSKNHKINIWKQTIIKKLDNMYRHDR